MWGSAKGWRYRIGVVLVVVLAVGAVIRENRPLPEIGVIPHQPSPITAAGPLPALPWPTDGQAAVAMPSISAGALEATPNERAVPIASLAKLMTAYLVLQRHPLSLNSSGPELTITAAQVNQYAVDVAQDQSSIQVVVGERLSEYQLLQALLIRSANNIAQLLADWVTGSQQAFVTLMNQTADQLGLTSLHFADASGFNQETRGTAQALVTIAALDMRNRAFSHIVDAHTVTLPIVGTLPNIVKRIGTSNVVGIKSGFTIWSGGCAAIATRDTIGSESFRALAVVLDQQGPGSLHRAANLAEELAEATGSDVVHVKVVAASQRVATLRIPWRHGSRAVGLKVSHSLSLSLWPGEHVTYREVIHRKNLLTQHTGGTVGYLQVRWPDHDQQIPIIMTESISAPSVWWRLLNG